MSSTTEVRGRLGERLEGLSGEELVELVASALGRLAAEPLDALGDAALAASVSRLQRLETMVAAEKLRRIAEVDAREAWRAEGHRSTADLLAGRLGLTPGEARAQADTATALARLPRTAARLRAGELGVGQAQVATRALVQLPAEHHGRLDALVAEQGEGLDAGGCATRSTRGPTRWNPSAWPSASGAPGNAGGCASPLMAPMAGWWSTGAWTASAGPSSSPPSRPSRARRARPTSAASPSARPTR
jgi:hypothetical protein